MSLPAQRPGPRGRVVALGAVVAVLASACLGLALLDRSYRQARAEFSEARVAAATAAGQLVLNLDALSATTVDEDIARVGAQATGEFKQLFTKAQGDLKKIIVERQVISRGRLTAVGVVRSDTDTATVLVVVERTLKDKTHKDGVVKRERWKVTIEKHNGRWLVSELTDVA